MSHKMGTVNDEDMIRVVHTPHRSTEKDGFRVR